MLGRCGAQFLMMDHAGIKYKHVTDFEEIAAKCSAFGGKTGEGLYVSPWGSTGFLFSTRVYLCT